MTPPLTSTQPDSDTTRPLFGSGLAVESFVRSLSDADALRLISGRLVSFRRLWELLDYNRKPIVVAGLRKFGIPGIRFTDGPRGVVMAHATCFPVAMARGATFDVELEREVGDVIGREARALGANLWAGACVNILRHPGWGRAQETYGEDPHHVGRMGAAVIQGVQQHVMACVKHFACNSIEDSRFRVDVQVDDRALREVYLVAFRHAVEAGVASVMSAYNRVNSRYCGHCGVLLTDILRGEMKFDGFVMSDFFLGVRDGAVALSAGLDLEMPIAWRAGTKLAPLLKEGRVSREDVDRAAIRILRQQVRFSEAAAGERKDLYPPSILASPDHRALARKAAVDGVVLLKNERDLLPLSRPFSGTVAVFGPLLDAPNTGDQGSSKTRPPDVVTLRRGLEEALGGENVVFHPEEGPRIAARIAADADVAVVVAGFSHKDEGENILFIGGDRKSLRLRKRDEERIQAVAAVQPRTIVVLIGGSAIVTEAWRDKVSAILMAWYPGMEGGHAVADVLLGRSEPGGRLPCVFPRQADQLPFFDPKAGSVVYDLLHGYRLMDSRGEEPAFAFGFGLGYTRFQWTDIDVQGGDDIRVRCCLRNIGPRRGAEVVQVYVGKPSSRVTRPPRELKAFRKVRLAPGTVERVELRIPLRELAFWDVESRAWSVEAGMYRVWVGTSSRMADLTPVDVQVRP